MEKIVVLWTANTERYSQIVAGLNDTKENLFKSLEKNEAEISPSTIYALACIHENIPFINGSPQNTFVPGVIEYAIEKKSLIGGDDFKSGQTKMKSVLVDFLVGAGIKVYLLNLSDLLHVSIFLHFEFGVFPALSWPKITDFIFSIFAAHLNCELQPLGKQWWNESLSSSNFPIQRNF